MLSDSDDVGLTKLAPTLLGELDSEFDHLSEKNVDKIKKLLDPFQDSPQLIDSRLEPMIKTLMDRYMESKATYVFEVVYTICKVRGAKVVSRFFSSDASMLEEVISDLEHSPETWQQRYVLLLWLAILVLSPFDLETFGDKFEDRVYNAAIQHISVPGKERDAAALVMARLCTRSAQSRVLLDRFFKYARHEVENNPRCDAKTFSKLGILQTLAIVWRIANPREVVSYCDQISFEGNSILFHKLLVKNLGRIALVKMALTSGYDDDGDSSGHNGGDSVSESVETILGQLMEYLGNQDSTVRYTASKAIARIVHKLDPELQQEVIEAILDIFEENIITINGSKSIDRVSSDKWHGALLCLAELLRRKLLVPESHIPRLVGILAISLPFEQKRLTAAVGSNVRDASCYVCWSLFRVYQNVSKPMLEKIFSSLVNLCCFDREVNIRRAASAAIQEGIGRQGDPVSLKRGLDLIQYVDYFNISRRARAFLEVSCQVYKLGYTDVNVLNQVDSWDVEIRRLASRAVGVLDRCTQFDYAAQLLNMYTKADFEIQHGVLLSLGELQRGVDEPVKVDECIKLLNEMTAIELQQENEQVNSEGFMHMFSGLYQHYNLLSEPCKVQLDELLETKVAMAMEIENESIVSDAKIVARVVSATGAVDHSDSAGDNGDDGGPVSPAAARAAVSSLGRHQRRLDSVLNQWVQGMNHNLSTFTRALADISPAPDSLRAHLIEAYRTKEVSTRRDALVSLGKVMSRQGGTSQEYSILLNALDEYSVDARGDVGSWIRHAAIDVILVLFDQAPLEFQQSVMRKLLRISAEVLDKLRIRSSEALALLCNNAEMRSIYQKIVAPQSDRQPGSYFSLLVEILPIFEQRIKGGEEGGDDNHDYEDLLESFLTGYVSSSGAISASTETIVAALQSLMDHLRAIDSDSQFHLLKRLIRLVNIPKYGAKTTVNALKTWSSILQSGYQLPAQAREKSFLRALFVKTYNAQINTKNTTRLLAAIPVFAALGELGQPDSVPRLVELCKHTLHPVRTQASEALYQVVMMVYGDNERYQNEFEQMLEILGVTDWDDMEEVQRQVGLLSDLVQAVQ